MTAFVTTSGISWMALTALTGCIAMLLWRSLRKISKQLQCIEERWTLATKGFLKGYVEVDFEKGSVWRSPGWLETMGYQEGEVDAKPDAWLELLHPDDRCRVEALMKDYLSRRVAAYDTEYRIRHRDGQYFWKHVHAEAIWDEHGKPVRLVGSVLDIHRRKQAEEDLRASETRYRELFQQHPLPAFVYNTRDFSIWDVNDAAIAHYGWSRAEFLNLTLHSIAMGGEFLAIEADLRSCAPGRRHTVPWRNRKKDGSVIWVELAAQEIGCSDFRTRLVIVNDVTARLESERHVKRAYAELEAQVERRTAELTESEMKWRALLECIPQLVWSTGANGEADFRSKQLIDYVGESEEGHGAGWATFLHPADRARIELIWQQALTNKASYDVEFRFRAKDGSYRWFKTRAVPVCDEHGAVLRWVGTCTDIEDQKRSEEALEEAVARRTLELAEARDRAEAATRAKSDFLAAMSHEIRTPMNGVIGMASLMMDTPLNSDQRCYMDTIRSSGEALLTVINDILDFSKIEAGRLDLERTPFDLSTLIEETCDLVRPHASAKNLPVVCVVDETIPLDLIGDPARLRQVVLNLLSNAVKFTAQGTVKLEVTQEAKRENTTVLRFAVQDSGIGLTEDQQRSLFQPFQQGDRSTSRRFGGTGLGLAICKRLVEMMGGTIGVSSQIGKGSTFFFNICLESAAVPQESAPLEGRTIGLVATPDLLQGSICKHLRRFGANVIPLSAIPQDPDSALFDIMLLDSAVVSREPIRAQRAASTANAVIILGSPADFASGATDGIEIAAYVDKPVRRLPLLRAICSVLYGKVQEEPERRSGNSGGAEGSRILLAEDNKVNQLVAKLLLEKLGCTVDIVENGVEACAAVQNAAYDLVLMDCQMPTMSGFEATKRIRAFEISGQRTPIVALTAGVLQEERDRCYAAGMDDFLSKPISQRDLENALERWLPMHSEAA